MRSITLSWRRPSLLVVFALACDGQPAERTVGEGPALFNEDGDADEAPNLSPFITDGELDSGHPAVGTLQSGGSGCSATLVGDCKVLTAAHCVGASSATFRLGSVRYSSSRIVRHPAYRGGSNDIALVLLAQRVTDVAPLRINTDPVRVGQAITLVGFGRPDGSSDQFGTKRMGENTIDTVAQTTFVFSGSSNVCEGDSGGPSLVVVGGEERVAGVHSQRIGACGNGGRDTRVDAYRSWIEAESCSPNPAAPGGRSGDPPPQDEPAEPPPASPPSADCHDGALFDSVFCSENCPCAAGEGDCDRDSECAAGLVCRHDVGQKYGTSERIDVCEATTEESPPSLDPRGGQAAKEGERCEQLDCGAGLLCTPVYTGSAKLVGSYCMEPCSEPGNDPACDGDEACTRARSGERVCFASNKPDQGYTDSGGAPDDPGGGSPPEDPSPEPTPPPQASGACGSGLESEVFALLNRERAEQGLSQLACEGAAVQVARKHSQDMCDRSFFSHDNPDGEDAGERLRAGGVSWRGWGENIAAGQRTAAQVHDGWMNSSGHRRNILNSSWTHTAIGHVSCSGGRYSTLWTEVFYRK